MVLMGIEISDVLARIEASQYTIFTQKLHSSLRKTLKKFNGHIHKKDNNHYWVSFKSINDAVQCALEVEHKFKYVTPKHKAFSKRLTIGLDWTEAVDHPNFKLVKSMCEWVNHPMVISSLVKERYETSNHHAEIDLKHIKTLSVGDAEFLLNLIDYLERHYALPVFDVRALGKGLRLTYPKLYRRVKRLTGRSPGAFIRAFRLQAALKKLHQREGTITQIAYGNGFKSATYFSDCFLKTYGIRPLRYQQQHGS
jgi:AraC-like DNA-binding protein